MRHLLAIVFTLIASMSAAQDREIEDVIRNQIEAFEVDDFASAFDYASPNIQRLFGDSERFGQMVRQGYPMVWRPSAIQFLELRDERGQLIQRLLVRDDQGRGHVLDYQMIRTENGWKINGVQLLRSPGEAA
jgi:hypothetical protein